MFPIIFKTTVQKLILSSKHINTIYKAFIEQYMIDSG